MPSTCKCEYVGSKHVLPGWGCCQCRVYNGLQRTECKNCGHPRGDIVIPENVARCPECGWGWEKDSPPDIVKERKICPSCAADWVETSLKDLVP